MYYSFLSYLKDQYIIEIIQDIGILLPTFVQIDGSYTTYNALKYLRQLIQNVLFDTNVRIIYFSVYWLIYPVFNLFTYFHLQLEFFLWVCYQAERHSSSKAAPEMQHYHHWMPWFDCYIHWTNIVAGNPIFQRPHPVKKNTTYRLFNSVSRQNDGLIERDPNTNIVNCSGSFNSRSNSKYFQRGHYLKLKVTMYYIALRDRQE